MPTTPKDASIRKRQQIIDSSRKMFLWVAGASVVVGFALVVSWFLLRQIWFKDTVINKKNETVSILEKNNKAAPLLTQNVGLLNTNDALRSARISESEKALQVILDALPAVDNKLALGASIQTKIVGGIQGVTLESFTVGDEASTGTTVLSPVAGVEVIPFQLSVSASDPNTLRDLMKRFEASIRTIDVDSMTLERNDSNLRLSVNGHAFYMPAVTVKLTDKKL